MAFELRSPLDFLRVDNIDREIELFRYSAAKAIGIRCREKCKDLPLGDKIRCIRDCESELFALAAARWRKSVSHLLYPLVCDYEPTFYLLLLYTGRETALYDPRYGEF